MGDAKKDPIQIFNYWGNIKDTKEMKMHDDVNMITGWPQVEKNREAVEAYLDLVQYSYAGAEGSGASRTPGPMGNRYYYDTGSECKNNGNKVPLHKYMNNVPDSRAGGGTVSESRGLVPGIIGNISKLSPLPIIQALASGGITPECSTYELNMINKDNGESSYASVNLTDSDAKNLDPCVFKPGAKDSKGIQYHKNPKDGSNKKYSTDQCKNVKGTNLKAYDGFMNMFNDKFTPSYKSVTKYASPHSNLPDDPLTNIYILSLSLFGIYIVKKVTEKI